MPMDIVGRLRSLGLELPAVPKPQGAYVPSVRVGNLVFVAGQLPIREGKPVCVGKVGRDVGLDEARAAARLCFLNALGALAYSADPSTVTRVVRLGGFVQCVDGFTEAFYGRPERFLDPAVRAAQSAWGFVDPAAARRGLARLERDLASGAWDARHGALRTRPEFVGALRLIVASP